MYLQFKFHGNLFSPYKMTERQKKFPNFEYGDCFISTRLINLLKSLYVIKGPCIMCLMDLINFN